ncbi:SH3 domain-containing protein [Pukyongiella litopenaei]|uniref:SH3 domain-containing protein n=2 Tax=Pukyongiella litopenaei TaxID=2605946 RepID=A0A2S0MV95_9RHOB|nr:SH3 domain-containing protein [Pukyongiella litopenaei]
MNDGESDAAQVARLDTSDTPPATVDRAALEAAVQAALGEDTGEDTGENTGPDAAATDPEVSETDMARVRASLTQGLSLFDDGQAPQTLQLASLSDGAASLTEAAPAPDPADIPAPAATFEQPPRDIREVIGTRVNMRDGPGTIYPVVARMRIGQQVEVMSDSGTGWLRLRTIPDGQPGWIASSLISKPAN